MNKRQKEVIQHQLDAEKAVLAQIEKQYKRALNDINNKIRIYQSDELTPSRIYHIQYQKALKKQVTAILEKLYSDEFSTIQQFLSNSYMDAFIGTFYDIAGQGIPIITPVDQKAAVKAIMTDTRLNKPLYDELGLDINELKKAVSAEITRGLATGSTYEDMARNLSFKTKAPLARANTIIRTESHRIQQASAEDARQVSKSKGADVVKQWDATLDGDTRDTHRQLDGQIRETNKKFSVGTKEAMYPGDFGDPAEDCNCRCVALTRARWALDEDELETLKERAEFFGLDKTKNFDDFKQKYLNASAKTSPSKVPEPLNNQGKSGIMDVKKSTQRAMSNNGRTSKFHVLTQDEIEKVYEDADSLEIPRNILRFNEGDQTSFDDETGLIFIRGDILPDPYSILLRDNLSQKAVLAHEYYGHYMSHPSHFRIGDWRDEFMASYNAAVNAPNLSEKDRRMLMLDAYDRAKEAGVTVTYNKKARELIYGHD